MMARRGRFHCYPSAAMNDLWQGFLSRINIVSTKKVLADTPNELLEYIADCDLFEIVSTVSGNVYPLYVVTAEAAENNSNELEFRFLARKVETEKESTRRWQ